MADFIAWCNTNNGFLTAILSMIGTIISVLAIIVSISTARLPFKKRVKLSSSISVSFSKGTNTEETNCETLGISINIANTGSRNIYITYLGISLKDKSRHKGYQKLTKFKYEITGTGVIQPTEIKEELYKKDDLIYNLSNVDKRMKLYICALDTEGTIYKKRIGNVETMLKNFTSN